MQRTPTCQNCCRNFIYKDPSRPHLQRVPLLLKCGHTFCEACVNKWFGQLKTHVTCPECQAVTPVTEGEPPVKFISPNLYQLGILTANRKTKLESDCKKPPKRKVSGKIVQKALSQFSSERKAAQLKAEEGTASLKCEECFLAVATSRCPKCESVFCQLCFEKVHISSNILRKHKPVPLSSTSDIIPGCPKHDNRPFEFYDKTVNQPVCSHCVVIGDRQGHEIAPSSDVAASLQDDFKLSLEASKKTLSHLQKSEKKICDCLPLLNLEKSQLVNGIRDHFQSLHAALQVREEQLIQEVENKSEEKNSLEALRQSVTDSIKTATSYIQEVEYILDDPLKLIAKTKQLLSQLDEIQEAPCCAVKMDCEPDSEKITYDGKLAELITSYGTLATDGKNRFIMKKLSEVTAEDLSDSEKQPAQEDSVSSSVKDDTDAAPDAVSGMRRSMIASKLLHMPYRHELVHVTHIVDPCHFFVQRLADTEQLDLIMNAINVSCEHSDDPNDLFFEVKVGQVCCCQFTEDNQWYRARVISVYSPSNLSRYPTLENGLCVEVTYIDYGNNEWVPLSSTVTFKILNGTAGIKEFMSAEKISHELRKMEDKFLEVTELGVACALTDIVPPFEEQKWPAKAIKAFGSLTGDKPLLMTVSDRLGGKLCVDLRTPEDDEPTQDDDRPASVRDALVFLEVARFISPASRPVAGGQVFLPSRIFKEPSDFEKNSFKDVLVTHVVGPEEIYLHKIDNEETLELNKIMTELSRMYDGRGSKDKWRVPWPYRGLVCGARFSEDGVWYRALITAVHSDDTVDVSYVDFGNSETRPFSEIRKLPDMFLRLPKQTESKRNTFFGHLASCAYLADIKPCGESTDWSEEVKSKVVTMLFNKPLVAKAQDSDSMEGKIPVLLYDTSHAYDVCINEMLIQNNLAEPAGLGLVKTREELLQALQMEKTETSSQSEVEEKTNATEIQETVVKSQAPPQKDTHDPSPASFRHYLPPELPNGKRFLLGVTYVDDDGFIYGQEMKEGDRTLIEIMSQLQKLELIDIPDSNFRLAPGLPCCALYADDGMWYRARVVCLCQDGKVLVNYVDFGNSEAIELDALRLETPFMHIPQQCLQLVLHGIEPNTPDGKWLAEGLNMLKYLIIGAECVATIKSQRIPGSPFLVAKLALPDGRDVSSLMVTKGLGRLCSPRRPNKDARKNNVEKSPAKDEPLKDIKGQAKAITLREVNSMLAHTKLPEVGVEFDVTITQIDQPDCVFIQRVPPPEGEKGLSEDEDLTIDDAAAELQQLELMAQRINQPDYFNKLPPLATAWKGMLCCGRYTQDDMWYRAEVLRVECEKPLECHLLYIDYGTSEVVKCERLRGFPSILLELPRQAVQCHLDDIQPPDNYDGPLIKGMHWPVDSMETLIELVAGKKLIAKILSTGPPVRIVLFFRVTREDGSTQDISVGKKLAEKGLALHVDDVRAAGVDSAEDESSFGPTSDQLSSSVNEGSSEIFNDDLSKPVDEISLGLINDESSGPINADAEEKKKRKVFEFPDEEEKLPFIKEEETKQTSTGAEAAAAMLEKILAPSSKVAFSSTPATRLLTPSQIVGKKSHPRSDSPRRISANIGLPAMREGKNQNAAPPPGGKETSPAMTLNKEEENNETGTQDEKALLESSGSAEVLSHNESECEDKVETEVEGGESGKVLDEDDAEVKSEIAEVEDESGKVTTQGLESLDEPVATTETNSEKDSNTANINKDSVESAV